MIAIALALGYPFKLETVSLIGFSLGCQVIKSCIKMLNKIGANDIIHNVTLLGGATSLQPKANNTSIIDSLSQTINGEIKNVHTIKDIVLLLYSLSTKKKAIGRNKLFIKDENLIKNYSEN